ncbi:tyrosine-type recombinase/integrase [Rummeliibacillus stabekisii]|uniref:tyrosine-type recombinase/integrase n=1 Tax=Rummeliibacillus stabekisii TaxID=241244 RepID=UPI00116F4D55|nr:tyrosine-type recombinase/integrase [Rummeliibacillus stabekisii]MBB5170712.1 site-specific recombinase XerD [Rummeliibacillus stabekisii]GEL06206.1 integrase [Rummeliibacillus stabekisii]
MNGKRGWIKSDQQIREVAFANEELSNKGAYINLMLQLNSLARHAKGISVHKSLPQYYNHMHLFCQFLADSFNLKTLANFQDKHLVEYVLERQDEGKSAATIKNDLAAIRYFHDQLPRPRYQLGSNQALTKKYLNFNLEKRKFGGINRQPTELEYQALVTLARQSINPEMANIIQLCRELGLRVHEVVRLYRADAEKALRDDFLTVKGKGGLIREVPLSNHAAIILKDAMQSVERGDKLFVSKDLKAHQVIQRVQDFVKNNRNKVLDPLNQRPPGIEITMHSFRHAYAKDQYHQFIAKGIESNKTKLLVSKLIGHNRADVTDIYLAE